MEALVRSVSPSNIFAEMPRLKENWFVIASAIVRMQNELLVKKRRRKVKRSTSTAEDITLMMVFLGCCRKNIWYSWEGA